MYSVLFAFVSCFFWAGFFKCWCDYIDAISERYAKTWFASFKNQQWWDFSKSGGNKWANGQKANGEAFFGSSTFLVGFTDAWHCFEGIFLLFLLIGTAIGIVDNDAFRNILASFNLYIITIIDQLLYGTIIVIIGFCTWGLGWQISEKLILVK